VTSGSPPLRPAKPFTALPIALCTDRVSSNTTMLLLNVSKMLVSAQRMRKAVRNSEVTSKPSRSSRSFAAPGSSMTTNTAVQSPKKPMLAHNTHRSSRGTASTRISQRPPTTKTRLPSKKSESRQRDGRSVTGPGNWLRISSMSREAIGSFRCPNLPQV
jgi:hypothetical protein